MKLNYKRTLLVGLAFLSICAFWQLYDNVVPLILKNTFDIPDDIAGVIMALDNVLALFLLPSGVLDGGLSGTAILLSKITPLHVSLFLVILNVPFFLFADPFHPLCIRFFRIGAVDIINEAFKSVDHPFRIVISDL